jgi:hypothetical protein
MGRNKLLTIKVHEWEKEVLKTEAVKRKTTVADLLLKPFRKLLASKINKK